MTRSTTARVGPHWLILALVLALLVVSNVSVEPQSMTAIDLDRPCTCKSEKRPCLFLHGLGDLPVGNHTATFPAYWGDIHDHAPCCSSTAFVHWDTINLGWHSQELQAAFCDAALHVSDGAVNRMIGKLILVAHSMGNLIAASALAAGTCKANKDNLTWVHVGGPMDGSWKANYIDQSVCQRHPDDGIWRLFKDAGKTFLQVVGNKEDMCPPPAGLASLRHQSTVPADHSASYAAAQRVHAAHVSKAACGVSSLGLASLEAISLATANFLHYLLAGHAALSDGAVDFDSCTFGLNASRFGTSYTDSFYKASVNHVDLAFKHGDGWWGSDRQPRKWFQCLL
ncbi:Aste57867_20182 [Aphanomyces stellatus]|uniref:Aste57867_20182 protein n=1 Tax=Aphanomyces stellatus TaxID=120398 RepID=A0A485LJ36_9STRA|nr:hypothetical protein As57867_020116 [Aphanomyces stellatus]VFT96876.1 Aste57867_20182 [Aphanomyces stellatus]